MALAKYYEDILDRFLENIDIVKSLSKNENRTYISEERWQVILTKLGTQINKAVKTSKTLEKQIKELDEKLKFFNNQQGSDLIEKMLQAEKELKIHNIQLTTALERKNNLLKNRVAETIQLKEKNAKLEAEIKKLRNDLTSKNSNNTKNDKSPNLKDPVINGVKYSRKEVRKIIAENEVLKNKLSQIEMENEKLKLSQKNPEEQYKIYLGRFKK